MPPSRRLSVQIQVGKGAHCASLLVLKGAGRLPKPELPLPSGALGPEGLISLGCDPVRILPHRKAELGLPLDSLISRLIITLRGPYNLNRVAMGQWYSREFQPASEAHRRSCRR